mmetsp:Transcript_8654/g.13426  ORF Transcript_8654/g.13426 Transcript_8654/m.13426 type:complete len:143 (+) Transcript_8654:280-708(+)
MNSGWKAIFDTFVLFVVAYSIFTTSLYVSFDPDIPETFELIDEAVFYIFSLDFVLNFFVEFMDQETFLKVRDHKKIAIRYARSGWMFIDFVATFPIDKFLGLQTDFIVTKLLRLTRLSRLWALLDLSRVNRLLKQLFESSQR